MQAGVEQQKRTAEQLSRICEQVDMVKNGLDFEVASKEQILKRLTVAGNKMEQQKKTLVSMGNGLETCLQYYRDTDGRFWWKCRPGSCEHWNNGGSCRNGSFEEHFF